MKEITVTIDSDDLGEILHEHLGRMFPGMKIARMPYMADITIRLRRDEPELPPPAEPFVPELPALPPGLPPLDREEPF